MRRQLLSAAAALCVALCCAAGAGAQSGRGMMHGYVEFEGVSYNDLPASRLRAKVELHGLGEYNHEEYAAETDGHGLYDVREIRMGEYALRITAPGYAPYETRLLIPSDFECRLATALKKAGAKVSAKRTREGRARAAERRRGDE